MRRCSPAVRDEKYGTDGWNMRAFGQLVLITAEINAGFSVEVNIKKNINHFKPVEFITCRLVGVRKFAADDAQNLK